MTPNQYLQHFCFTYANILKSVKIVISLLICNKLTSLITTHLKSKKTSYILISQHEMCLICLSIKLFNNFLVANKISYSQRAFQHSAVHLPANATNHTFTRMTQKRSALKYRNV